MSIVKRRMLAGAAVLVLAFLFVMQPQVPEWEMFVSLMFGWIPYLANVLPRVSFSTEIALHAAVALMLGAIGLYGLIRVWRRLRESEWTSWRFTSTLKVTGMLLLLFATSVAATGIVHQVGWLSGRESVVVMKSGVSGDRSNLLRARRLFLSLVEFAADSNGNFPVELEQLVPRYLASRIDLYAKSGTSGVLERYWYFPEATDSVETEDLILALPQVESREFRGVMFRDGSIRRIRETEYRELLAKREAYLAAKRVEVGG